MALKDKASSFSKFEMIMNKFINFIRMIKFIRRRLFGFSKYKEANPELGFMGQEPDLKGK